MSKLVYYISIADGKPLRLDRANNKWWIDGSRSLVYIPVFKKKNDAKNLCQRARKDRPDLIDWTKVLEVEVI